METLKFTLAQEGDSLVITTDNDLDLKKLFKYNANFRAKLAGQREKQLNEDSINKSKVYPLVAYTNDMSVNVITIVAKELKNVKSFFYPTEKKLVLQVTPEALQEKVQQDEEKLKLLAAEKKSRSSKTRTTATRGRVSMGRGAVPIRTTRTRGRGRGRGDDKGKEEEEKVRNFGESSGT